VVGSVIGSAAIAGIVIGIVLAFVGCGSAGAFAYYNMEGIGKDSMVSNNPIYENSKNQGHNPLHRV